MKHKLKTTAVVAIMMGASAFPSVAMATTEPSVSIYGFTNYARMSSSTLVVRIPCSNAEYVHLWLNGKYQGGTYYGGWEHYTLSLSSGKNVISAQVLDKYNSLKSRIEHKYVTYTAPTISYSVYDFYGNKQGSYSSLSAAESAVKSYPRGTVRATSGQVVYTQAGYAAYQDPAHLIGVYSAYTQASDEAGSAGYVVNANNNVDKQPSNFYYLKNGQWVSSEYGVEGSETPPSSDVQTSIRYLPVTVHPGNSPYDTEYYPLETATTGDGKYIGKSSDSFIWENSYRTVNLMLPSGQPTSGSNIDNYIEQTAPSSSLYGLGYSYMDAEKFGSNAVYLFSHSTLESGWGNSPIAQNKNNLFGYGAYDTSPDNDAGSFPSDDYAIHFESWFVRQVYLTQGGRNNTSLGPTLDGMSEGGYATDPNWSAAIAGLINHYADTPANLNSSSNGYSETNAEPITPITDLKGPNGEPIYVANDFQANVPTFPGNLSEATSGTNDYVKTLQDALNASGCGPIDVDGQFESTTLAAVKKYQGKVELPETGVVNQIMWDKLFPSISELTSISEIYMSYTNNLAISKVETNTGVFVFEPFIHFTNVYRLEPVNGATGPQARITVYSGDNPSSYVLQDSYGQIYLHAGDYVSNDNGGMADANGMVKVSFTQWRNGSPVEFTGYVPVSAIQMPKDTAGKNTMPTYNGLDPSHE